MTQGLPFESEVTSEDLCYSLTTDNQALLMRYATVSWAATLTEKLDEAEYVPDKSLPAHISCTFHVPDVPKPGTLDKVNCLVAVLDDVLIMNTWIPLEDFPE